MVLDSMKLQPVDNVIAELNTLNTFVKVKGNSFDIGKTLFSFVEFDKNTKKFQKSVDCYMGLEESLIFCHDVLSGKLPKLAAKEKAKGEQYPKAVWFSPLGGVNEQKAKERKLRSDGKAISRSFNIAPGSKADFVVTVTQGAGERLGAVIKSAYRGVLRCTLRDQRLCTSTEGGKAGAKGVVENTVFS